MAIKKQIGIAPLVIGIVLGVQSLSKFAQGDISTWSIVILVGSCAAIFVGINTLFMENQSNEDSNTESDSRFNTTLAGLTVLSFIAGAIAFFI